MFFFFKNTQKSSVTFCLKCALCFLWKLALFSRLVCVSHIKGRPTSLTWISFVFSPPTLWKTELILFLLFQLGKIENHSKLWTILLKPKRSFTFLLKSQLFDPIFVFHLYFAQGKFQMSLTLSGNGTCFFHKVMEEIVIICQMWFLGWCKGIMHLNTFTF